MQYDFEWDLAKEAINIEKHGVDFRTAAKAFLDPERKIFMDIKHSQTEDRFFCVAKVGMKIIKVRFTVRGQRIRIIGAGYWRKGITYYEQEKI